MKKKILLIIILLGTVGLGVAFFLYNKPSEMVVSSKADFTVNASDLYTAFEENEVKANEKYLNKVVLVSGIVTEITEGVDQSVNITLNDGNKMFGISCQVTEGYKQGSVNVGDSLIVKGLCTGILMDVVLVKCAIEEVI